ncbi:hypothetical protein EJB05_25107, partial [Eragrostis curvula]
MTAEEFFTPTSSPEPRSSASPATEEPTAPQRDALEIVVEERLRQDDGGMMSIFRVPAHVREASKELYEPRLVSIGPYHRGREAVRAMEQHKWRFLRELVAMRPEASLANYVAAVRAVEQRARRCYSERTDLFDATAEQVQGGGDQNADGFAGMLLLDGCFIIQYFIKWHNGERDQLCDVGWGPNLVQSDLLLMENQIPFFVLEELFGVLAPEADKTVDLRRLILPHLSLDDSNFFRELVLAREVHHLLHLVYEAFLSRPAEMAAGVQDEQDSRRVPQQRVARLREVGVRLKAAASKRFVFVRSVPCWTPLTSLSTLLREAAAWFGKLTAPIGVIKAPPRQSPEPSPQQSDLTPPRSAPAAATLVVPSVTLLRGAGVRFEKAASPRHMLDVTFDRATGVVRMPRVELDHANKPLLVNLVAFEQTTRNLAAGAAARPLSSYAALMSSLVKTGRDVAHLQRRGVVDNLLDGDDDAAKCFFQKLGDCSTLEYGDHLFADLFEELNAYYRSSWRRHRARFLRDYCSSPWAMVALAAGVFAFCFTIVKFSTVIYGLVHPKHDH